MSDLNIKEMKIAEAKQKNLSSFDIMLKEDGTLMYYTEGNLISPREIIRNDRFPHIKKILDKNGFPSCFGEMYIDERGANVFDVSSKENWNRAKFMIIDLKDNSIPYVQRQRIIADKVKEINDKSISPVIRFDNIEQGWKYVLDNEEEGLILRNKDYPSEWYKVKTLKEAKLRIVDWESGSDKGTFILENGSRISGTSVGYVQQYKDITENGNIAIAEVEFPFLTKDGKLFQPRLRRIGIANDIKGILK